MLRSAFILLFLYLSSSTFCIRIRQFGGDLFSRLNTSALGGISLETNETGSGVSEVGAGTRFAGRNVTGETGISGETGTAIRGGGRSRTVAGGESETLLSPNRTEMTTESGSAADVETEGGEVMSTTVSGSTGGLRTSDIQANTTTTGSTIIRIAGGGRGSSATLGGTNITIDRGAPPSWNAIEPSTNATRPTNRTETGTEGAPSSSRGHGFTAGGSNITLEQGEESERNATRPVESNRTESERERPTARGEGSTQGATDITLDIGTGNGGRPSDSEATDIERERPSGAIAHGSASRAENLNLELDTES